MMPKKQSVERLEKYATMRQGAVLKLNQSEKGKIKMIIF
jgi:hypothetical protein